MGKTTGEGVNFYEILLTYLILLKQNKSTESTFRNVFKTPGKAKKFKAKIVDEEPELPGAGIGVGGGGK